MYDELVKSLRFCATHDCMHEGEEFVGCTAPFEDNYEGITTCNDALMMQAADAIEELLVIAQRLKHERLVYDGHGGYVRESRWISVEERLPEEDGDYLVWFYDARCHKVAEFNKHTAKERHIWWFAGVDRTKFVTHWMPLPEPPKEETDGKENKK